MEIVENTTTYYNIKLTKEEYYTLIILAGSLSRMRINEIIKDVKDSRKEGRVGEDYYPELMDKYNPPSLDHNSIDFLDNLYVKLQKGIIGE